MKIHRIQTEGKTIRPGSMVLPVLCGRRVHEASTTVWDMDVTCRNCKRKMMRT